MQPLPRGTSRRRGARPGTRRGATCPGHHKDGMGEICGCCSARAAKHYTTCCVHLAPQHAAARRMASTTLVHLGPRHPRRRTTAGTRKHGRVEGSDSRQFLIHGPGTTRRRIQPPLKVAAPRFNRAGGRTRADHAKHTSKGRSSMRSSPSASVHAVYTPLSRKAVT